MAPNVYIVIGPSAIAYEDETGEILETVDRNDDGSWDWSGAGICDERGAGSAEGFRDLAIALQAAESNATQAGFTVERVPRSAGLTV